jgi:hypothetical protein
LVWLQSKPGNRYASLPRLQAATGASGIIKSTHYAA